MKPDVWKAYRNLQEQVSGKQKEPTVDDFIQKRRLGNSFVVVVDFSPLDHNVRPQADQLYDAFVSALQSHDRPAVHAASIDFFLSTGFHINDIYDRAQSVRIQCNSPHPAARP